MRVGHDLGAAVAVGDVGGVRAKPVLEVTNEDVIGGLAGTDLGDLAHVLERAVSSHEGAPGQVERRGAVRAADVDVAICQAGVIGAHVEQAGVQQRVALGRLAAVAPPDLGVAGEAATQVAVVPSVGHVVVRDRSRVGVFGDGAGSGAGSGIAIGHVLRRAKPVVVDPGAVLGHAKGQVVVERGPLQHDLLAHRQVQEAAVVLEHIGHAGAVEHVPGTDVHVLEARVLCKERLEIAARGARYAAHVQAVAVEVLHAGQLGEPGGEVGHLELARGRGHSVIALGHDVLGDGQTQARGVDVEDGVVPGHSLGGHGGTAVGALHGGAHGPVGAAVDAHRERMGLEGHTVDALVLQAEGPPSVLVARGGLDAAAQVLAVPDVLMRLVQGVGRLAVARRELLGAVEPVGVVRRGIVGGVARVGAALHDPAAVACVAGGQLVAGKVVAQVGRAKPGAGLQREGLQGGQAREHVARHHRGGPGPAREVHGLEPIVALEESVELDARIADVDVGAVEGAQVQVGTLPRPGRALGQVVLREGRGADIEGQAAEPAAQVVRLDLVDRGAVDIGLGLHVLDAVLAALLLVGVHVDEHGIRVREVGHRFGVHLAASVEGLEPGQVRGCHVHLGGEVAHRGTLERGARGVGGADAQLVVGGVGRVDGLGLVDAQGQGARAGVVAPPDVVVLGVETALVDAVLPAVVGALAVVRGAVDVVRVRAAPGVAVAQVGAAAEPGVGVVLHDLARGASGARRVLHAQPAAGGHTAWVGARVDCVGRRRAQTRIGQTRAPAQHERGQAIGAGQHVHGGGHSHGTRAVHDPVVDVERGHGARILEHGVEVVDLAHVPVGHVVHDHEGRGVLEHLAERDGIGAVAQKQPVAVEPHEPQIALEPAAGVGDAGHRLELDVADAVGHGDRRERRVLLPGHVVRQLVDRDVGPSARIVHADDQRGGVTRIALVGTPLELPPGVVVAETTVGDVGPLVGRDARRTVGIGRVGIELRNVLGIALPVGTRGHTVPGAFDGVTLGRELQARRLASTYVVQVHTWVQRERREGEGAMQHVLDGRTGGHGPVVKVQGLDAGVAEHLCEARARRRVGGGHDPVLERAQVGQLFGASEHAREVRDLAHVPITVGSVGCEAIDRGELLITVEHALHSGHRTGVPLVNAGNASQARGPAQHVCQALHAVSGQSRGVVELEAGAIEGEKARVIVGKDARGRGESTRCHMRAQAVVGKDHTRRAVGEGHGCEARHLAEGALLVGLVDVVGSAEQVAVLVIGVGGIEVPENLLPLVLGHQVGEFQLHGAAASQTVGAHAQGAAGLAVGGVG